MIVRSNPVIAVHDTIYLQEEGLRICAGGCSDSSQELGDVFEEAPLSGSSAAIGEKVSIAKNEF